MSQPILNPDEKNPEPEESSSSSQSDPKFVGLAPVFQLLRMVGADGQEEMDLKLLHAEIEAYDKEAEKLFRQLYAAELDQKNIMKRSHDASYIVMATMHLGLHGAVVEEQQRDLDKDRQEVLGLTQSLLSGMRSSLPLVRRAVDELPGVSQEEKKRKDDLIEQLDRTEQSLEKAHTTAAGATRDAYQQDAYGQDEPEQAPNQAQQQVQAQYQPPAGYWQWVNYSAAHPSVTDQLAEQAKKNPEVTGAAVGAVVGAVVGLGFGPLGMAVGAVAGGLAGGFVGALLGRANAPAQQPYTYQPQPVNPNQQTQSQGTPEKPKSRIPRTPVEHEQVLHVNSESTQNTQKKQP